MSSFSQRNILPQFSARKLTFLSAPKSDQAVFAGKFYSGRIPPKLCRRVWPEKFSATAREAVASLYIQTGGQCYRPGYRQGYARARTRPARASLVITSQQRGGFAGRSISELVTLAAVRCSQIAARADKGCTRLDNRAVVTSEQTMRYFPRLKVWKAGKNYFDGKQATSYDWYTYALKLDDGRYVVTSKPYSITTSKHLNDFERMFLRDMPSDQVIRIHAPGGLHDVRGIIRDIEYEIAELEERIANPRCKKEWRIALVAKYREQLAFVHEVMS